MHCIIFKRQKLFALLSSYNWRFRKTTAVFHSQDEASWKAFSSIKCQIHEGKTDEGQCTYNLTLRHFHVTIFAMENKYYIFWVCMCSLSFPACKEHAPCILSSLAYTGLPHFSTLSHKWRSFLKKVIEHKICVLIFSTNFTWNISHVKKNSGRCYHKRKEVFVWGTRCSCQILMKPESFW
jgi:hypothetical protein